MSEGPVRILDLLVRKVTLKCQLPVPEVGNRVELQATISVRRPVPTGRAGQRFSYH